jgi:glycosyltransferase involved in cell wall biosynthesis
VLTTDHSGIFDVFADGVNGYAVVPEDVGSLAAALERAVTGPDALATIAKANLETAKHCYRADIYAAKLVSIISKVHDART